MVNNYKICPKCNEHIENESKFCTKCGYKFEVTTTITQQPVMQTTTIQSATNYNNLILCPNCKNYEYKGYQNCRRCGYFIGYNQGQNLYNNTSNLSNFQNNTRYQQSSTIQVINPSANNIIGTILTLLGLIGCMISVFLPFLSMSAFGYTDSQNLFDNSSDAYIILFLCLLDLIIVLCKCKTHGLDTIIVGIIMLSFSGFHFMDLKEKITQMGDYSSIVKLGSGIYVLIICSILVIAGGFTLFASQRSSKKINKR